MTMFIQDQCFLFNPNTEINVVSLIVVSQPLTAVHFIYYNCYMIPCKHDKVLLELK